MRELQTKHAFRVCETNTAVFQTTEGDRELGAVPANWMKWRGKPVLITDQGRTIPLDIAPDRSAAEADWGTDAGGEADEDALAGHPRAVLISEPEDENATAAFEVYPIPDGLSLYANGEYRIRIPYFKYLTALSAVGDSNWFTTNADEWLIWKAASEAFFLNWDQQQGLAWLQKANGKLQEVINRDKKERIAGLITLAPQPRVNGSRLASNQWRR